MANNIGKLSGRKFLAISTGGLLGACLTACDSTDGGLLKKAADVTAVAAIEIASPSKVGTIRNAWKDAGGIWHWTRVEQGVGTFDCEGRDLGTPDQCEQVSPQW